jgi:hypothetical protein
VSSDTGHEGKVRADCLAGEGDELIAFFPGEEEGFGVGAHHDKTV